MAEGEPCPGYYHREHTADEIVVGLGRTLEEAFEQAAIGVYEVMTDTSKVLPRRRFRVEAAGVDLENLLYRFIEELLILTDAEGVMFSVVKVCGIDKVGDEYRVEASAWGEPFDPERHEHRTYVKAVTYAEMEVKQLSEACWRVQFVVDI